MTSTHPGPSPYVEPKRSLPVRISRAILGEKLHVRIASYIKPSGVTLANYAPHLAFADKHRLGELPGDVCELGAWLGGGTRVLSAWAQKHGKKVHVIDLWPNDDFEKNPRYYNLLRYGRTSWEAFNKLTRGLPNLVIYRCDSKQLELPKDVKFSFAFIDGVHTPEYIRSDFGKIWPHVVPGGGLAFDDYMGGPGYRDYAAEVDKIVAERRAELSVVEPRPDLNTMYVVKRDPFV